MYHNPVLLAESVNALVTDPSGIYVDVTFGGGGHSRKILEKLSPDGRLLAFDQDADVRANLIDDPRFQFVPANFCHLKQFLEYHHAYPVHGILADLGVSSHQFDTSTRGFSHRLNGTLDMRMNSDKGISAQEIVNQYDSDQLTTMFTLYGELSMAKRIANRIVKERDVQSITTTEALIEVVAPLLPRGKENKVLSQIFQAIRIEVNSELEVLQAFLEQTTAALRMGGRLSVISYHSLEDRLVKNFMKSGNVGGNIEKDFFGNPLCPFRLVSNKVITPSNAEIVQNPRSRSAKLRIAEKIR